MKYINEFVVLIAILSFATCGGSSAQDKTRPDDGPDRGQAATKMMRRGELTDAKKSSSAVVPADFLRLSEVRLSPADINAAVDISAEAVVIPPVPEGIVFEYRWYINNLVVVDVVGSTLPSGSFRKNQWIICEARAKAGEKTSAWLKSNWLRIANSPPQVEPIVLDNFNVPGQFRYQITVSDIDKDELTYELLAPLDAGIELDKKSGLLTWKIDDKTIEKLGETIVISLSVSDNDAKPTTGSITLRFQKKKAE